MTRKSNDTDTREDIKKSMEQMSKSDASDSKIDSMFHELHKKGLSMEEIAKKLYNEFPDEEKIVDSVIRGRYKNYRNIKERARKLAHSIKKKMIQGDYTLHEMLEKMLQYKKKHNINDVEYEEFRKELANILNDNYSQEIEYNQNVTAHRSRINRALGNTRQVQDDKMIVRDDEQHALNDIFSAYEKNLQLSREIYMSSLMHPDCGIVSMTGQYNRDRHIPTNHIHPLFACLYLPKFDLLETHTLHSNIGSIIKHRYEGKPIRSEADLLLFSDIVTDPNDVVCDINSPINDLRNRYRVQICLWNLVLRLRKGAYYEGLYNDQFMEALNTCRNNLYDNADLAYSQDDGSILRRFLSVFSLRPTIVYTKPLHALSAITTNPYAGMYMDEMLGNASDSKFTDVSYTGYPFKRQAAYTITSIPMITLQIPPYVEGSQPKDLRSATSQTLWINQGGTLIPKEHKIVYSKELLIFYVNRKIEQIQIKSYTQPLMLTRLPVSMSTTNRFQRVNTYPINIPPVLSLHKTDEIYHLRSVVAVNQFSINNGDEITNIATNSVGLIMKHRNFAEKVYDSSYYLYDPIAASQPVEHPTKDGWTTNKPITLLDPYFSQVNEKTGITTYSWFDIASTTGTIYIYAKPSGYNPYQQITI